MTHDANMGFTSRHYCRLLEFHADCQPLVEVARPADPTSKCDRYSSGVVRPY